MMPTYNYEVSQISPKNSTNNGDLYVTRIEIKEGIKESCKENSKENCLESSKGSHKKLEQQTSVETKYHGACVPSKKCTCESGFILLFLVISFLVIFLGWDRSRSLVTNTSQYTHETTSTTKTYQNITQYNLTTTKVSEPDFLTTVESNISTTVSAVTGYTTTEIITSVTSKTDDNFQCKSTGALLSHEALCNGIVECVDFSDESSCECSENQYRCANGLCIINEYMCDRINHCIDFSDEVNCTCTEEEFKCRNGLCIATTQVCDQMDQCGDESDELNCPCEDTQWRCNNSMCINIEWLCDAHPDCSDSSDEQNCHTCKENEYVCKNYECIEINFHCDGKADCTDGSDEQQCVKLINTVPNNNEHLLLLEIWSNDTQSWLPVCGDNWNAALAHGVCSHLGQQNMVSTIMVNALYPSYIVRKPDRHGVSLLGQFRTSFICSSNSVVTLRCDNKTCGTRSSVPQPMQYIIGGQLVTPGKWPWVVAIEVTSNKGRPFSTFCGGTLINEKWIVIAGHCTTFMQHAQHVNPTVRYYIRLGTIYSTKFDSNRKLVPVESIITHPNFTALSIGGSDNDIGLIQLKDSLVFTDFIRPICVHREEQVFALTSTCFIAGWGYAGFDDAGDPVTPSPEILRDAKNNLLPDASCTEHYGSEFYSNHTMLCGGYETGHPTSCQGDSGGPLMCLDENNRWTLVGVVSWGAPGCIGKPMIFTRVHSFLSWITETITNNSQ